MILNVILALTGVAALASVINLFENKTKAKSVDAISLEKQMPGNLPIIALSSNGNVLNFILDSGSNISHICAEYHECLDAEPLGTDEEEEVTGLGGASKGVTMCRATLKDIMSREYEVDLSVSSHLSSVAKAIEASTGIQIHGLLGTDFLRRYNYVLNFKALEVYPQL